MIVKIQRPLFSTEEQPMALVYNRSRSFEANMPLTPDIADLFGDGEAKVYHQATLDGTQLLIGRRVPGEPF